MLMVLLFLLLMSVVISGYALEKYYLWGFSFKFHFIFQSNCTIELLTFNKYKHLFSITEKNLCLALHKYMGELMYEIERNVGMSPGVCPIPKVNFKSDMPNEPSQRTMNFRELTVFIIIHLIFKRWLYRHFRLENCVLQKLLMIDKIMFASV